MLWRDLEKPDFKWDPEMSVELFHYAPATFENNLDVAHKNLGAVRKLRKISSFGPRGNEVLVESKMLSPKNYLHLNELTMFVFFESQRSFLLMLKGISYLNIQSLSVNAYMGPVEADHRLMQQVSEVDIDDIFVGASLASPELILRFHARDRSFKTVAVSDERVYRSFASKFNSIPETSPSSSALQIWAIRVLK